MLTSESKQEKRLPPNQKSIKRLLRWGIDHPGITSANPKVDTKTYTLTINGEVNNPVKVTWTEVLQLPKTVSVSDFHCFEDECAGMQVGRRTFQGQRDASKTEGNGESSNFRMRRQLHHSALPNRA